jgi:hypothetical protein
VRTDPTATSLTGDRSTGTSAASTPWVAASADELLAGATDHTSFNPDDGKSGSTFEWVVIDGERYLVKSLSRSTDWITRVIHDPDYWTFRIWQAGLMNAAPPEIDHTVVGMALDGEGDDARLTMLMRDVGEHLIPEGDDTVSETQHLALIDGLAALSARFWGWEDTIGLSTLGHRFRFFAPDNIQPELDRVATRDELPVPIRVADEGWRLLLERSPVLAALCGDVHRDPRPLSAALQATPQTFLQGDWKMGNLGVYPDGRTILLDWAYPGAGPACLDLAWYLSLNAARLPMSKEDTVDLFRADLERRGIDTDGWFERQVELSLLGMAAAFGWEKAHSGEDELRWWEEAAVRGSRWL